MITFPGVRLDRQRVDKGNLVPALIVLPKVYAPVRQGLSVVVLVLELPRIAHAGAYTRVAIETELEAHGVELVGHKLDAVGEAPRIAADLAEAVAGGRQPGVVEVDKDVAGVAEACLDHPVGHVEHDRLAQVAARRVPRRPACSGQSRDGRVRDRGGQQQCQGLSSRNTRGRSI